MIQTDPGDVVAFHVHLRNRAQGGLPRLSWTIDYLPWPGIADRERMRVVRDFVNDPSRAIAVERLKLLSVL